MESAGAFEDDDEVAAPGGRFGKSRAAARQVLSDKKDWGPAYKKKKSSMNIRTALLYRKHFPAVLEESVSPSPCFAYS